MVELYMIVEGLVGACVQVDLKRPQGEMRQTPGETKMQQELMDLAERKEMTKEENWVRSTRVQTLGLSGEQGILNLDQIPMSAATMNLGGLR
jgi:hypothetical protein